MKARVISNTELVREVHRVVVKGQEHKEFLPGQFIVFTLQEDGKPIMRPYSITSAPWEGRYEFAIRKSGHVSDMICDLTQDSEVDMSEPKGRFTLVKAEKYLFVCNGTGITPLRSMIRTLFRKYYSGTGTDTEQQVTLLSGARSKEDALFDEEMRQLSEENDNFVYHLVVSREEGSLQGYVQHHLDLVVDTRQDAFICGANDMVKEVSLLLKEKGIERIHTEFMGAGI